MNRRLWVNAVVFGIVGAALYVWAAFNVLSFDRVDRPFNVTAEFETSPGLLPAFQASYLGVAVGTIKSVDLADDKVRVVLKINRGTKLPADVSATVRRRSAVGEPYIDLAPLPGKTAKRAGPFLKEGDVIPVSRTTSPLEYSALFTALDRLVSAVPEDTLRTYVHELGVGLEGRAASLRAIIAGTDDITNTLATNAELFAAVLADVDRLVTTLNAHAGEIGSSYDNLARVTTALAAQKQSIITLLEEGPALSAGVSELFQQTGPDLGCLIDALGTVTQALAANDDAGDIRRLIGAGPDFKRALDDILDHPTQTDYPWLHAEVAVNNGDETAKVFPEIKTLPAAPALPRCASSLASNGGAGGKATSAAESPGADTIGKKDVSGGTRPSADSGDREASSQLPASSAGPPFAQAFLLVMLGTLLAFRPWRWLPGRQRGSD